MIVNVLILSFKLSTYIYNTEYTTYAINTLQKFNIQ